MRTYKQICEELSEVWERFPHNQNISFAQFLFRQLREDLEKMEAQRPRSHRYTVPLQNGQRFLIKQTHRETA